MKNYSDFGIELPAGSAGEIQTTCPECSPIRKKKTARCLSVNLDKAVWCCHHCGWTGSLNDGGQRPPFLHWQKPAFSKPAPKPAETGLPEKVVAWFADRGINEGVLLRNQIEYGETYMPQVEGWVNAIRFPYYRGGEIVNIKHRDGKKNFRMEAGCERVLYGLDDINPDQVIIVEGEIDKLSLEVAGYASVVSVPDGAPAVNTKDYASKFMFLDNDTVAGVQSWVIAVDSDEPGQRLEDELARRFGRDRCRRVRWPDDCKDANEVLVRHGTAVLADCVEHAEPYPLKGVFAVRDFGDRVRQLYEHGWERGLSTGWYALDEYYTVRPGELSVFTGIPNSGKSNFMDNLMVNMARRHGWHMAVFSPENQPIEDHIARLAEKWVGMPFTEGPAPRMSPEQLSDALKELQTHFHFILDEDDSEWTLDHILENAAALVFQHGVRGLVIDPWNELEHQRPSGQTETEYVGASLKRIRQFARTKGVHVWIVAHPSKLYREKNGTYPVPTLYDISGSAHWRNKSDNGLCVWRDFGNEQGVTELHVQKVRFRQVGKLGMAELRFDKVTHTYRDPDFISMGSAYRTASDGE